jgi:hypothetical protein
MILCSRAKPKPLDTPFYFSSLLSSPSARTAPTSIARTRSATGGVPHAPSSYKPTPSTRGSHPPSRPSPPPSRPGTTTPGAGDQPRSAIARAPSDSGSSLRSGASPSPPLLRAPRTRAAVARAAEQAAAAKCAPIMRRTSSCSTTTAAVSAPLGEDVVLLVDVAGVETEDDFRFDA